MNDRTSFSIIADETTDISVVEQFALCARYCDANKKNN